MDIYTQNLHSMHQHVPFNRVSTPNYNTANTVAVYAHTFVYCFKCCSVNIFSWFTDEMVVLLKSVEHHIKEH